MRRRQTKALTQKSGSRALCTKEAHSEGAKSANKNGTLSLYSVPFELSELSELKFCSKARRLLGGVLGRSFRRSTLGGGRQLFFRNQTR